MTVTDAEDLMLGRVFRRLIMAQEYVDAEIVGYLCIDGALDDVTRAEGDLIERLCGEARAANREPVTVTFEWGMRIDCAKNGCATPHRDDGVVHPYSFGQDRGVPGLTPAIINNHACTWVKRSITTTPWVDMGADVLPKMYGGFS